MQSSGETARRSWILAGTALIATAAAFFSRRIIPFQIDDASIFYRYAENVSLGLGPVFNRGELPVEGFTSPLWLFLLSLAARITSASLLPSTATVLGAAAYGGCLIVLTRGPPPSSCDSRASALVSALMPAALWGLSGATLFDSVTGLETTAFVLVVLLVHRSLAHDLSRHWAIIAASLALWTRPEGPWLLVAATAQLAFDRPARNHVRSVAIPAFVALLGSGLVLLLVRWSVFHDVLPNTYYAKRPLLSAGVAYLQKTILLPSVFPVLAGGALGAVLGESRHRGYAAAALAWAGAAVLEGGDWMPGARFLQPTLALAALASGGVGCAFKTGKRPAQRAVSLLVLPLVVVSAWSGWDRGDTVQREREARSDQRQLLRWFSLSRLPSIALLDIGELGFALPEVRITDLDGLTDARIGHTPGGHLRKRFDLGYLFNERRPATIVIRVRRLPTRDALGHLAPDPADSMSWSEGDILKDPRLLRDYRLLFVQAPAHPGIPLYVRVVYVQKGLQLRAEATPPGDVVTADPSVE